MKNNDDDTKIFTPSVSKKPLTVEIENAKTKIYKAKKK